MDVFYHHAASATHPTTTTTYGQLIDNLHPLGTRKTRQSLPRVLFQPLLEPGALDAGAEDGEGHGALAPSGMRPRDDGHFEHVWVVRELC